MNEILKLLEKRDLYTHIILFKIYLETKGNTDDSYGGNLRKEVKDLIGDEYSNEDFQNAEQYLESSGYLKDSISSCLTVHGRDYFERWIKNFETLSNDDKNLLEETLSEKAIKFLGVTKDSVSTVGSALKIIEFFTK